MMYAGSKNKLVQTAELTKVLSRSDMLIDDFLPSTAGEPSSPMHKCFPVAEACRLRRCISKASNVRRKEQ